MCICAAPSDGEDIFLIHVAAGAHAQVAQNAAAAIEQNFRVRCIELAALIELREVIVQHAQMISHRLQFAVAGFFARRANMVAFDEQHLRDGFARFVQFRGVIADFLSRYGWCDARGGAAVADFHHAQAAIAARR